MNTTPMQSAEEIKKWIKKSQLGDELSVYGFDEVAEIISKALQQQGGMRWVNCSDRMPTEAKRNYVFRQKNNTRSARSVWWDHMDGDPSSYLKLPLDNIEWLDESPLPVQDPWIEIKEGCEMPNGGDSVLLYSGDCFYLGYLKKVYDVSKVPVVFREQHFEDHNGHLFEWPITHWRPLPAPPTINSKVNQ